MKKLAKNDLPIMSTGKGKTVLFHPYIPKKAIQYVSDTLKSRWIGEGPKVKIFEKKFKKFFNIKGECIAVGSGTDALHLAYILAGIKKGDEVLAPLFTCTATNIPLLYIGAKIKFIDIDPQTLNVSIADLKKKISKKTKAIVCVHYAGIPCDMDEIKILANKYNAKVIEDAAHALGSRYNKKYIGNLSDFTIFSFQSIKQLTTSDGGMLVFKDKSLEKLAKRLRWFGIDREKKQNGIWENDIKEIGFKYQMTDIAASLGLAGLEEYKFTSNFRKKIFNQYIKNLKNYKKVNIINDFNSKKDISPWLFTIAVNNRKRLEKKLRRFGIESGQTHYRNDRYKIFKCKDKFKNMDLIDDKYLVLPLHNKVSIKEVNKICKIIKSGW
jgi:dTDP-4-amino-4,6-dideoxygalactose transaminase